MYPNRAVFDGGLWGLNPPPAKISDPPAAIKKRKVDFNPTVDPHTQILHISMYLCISTVVDFNSQNFDPPPNEI